MSDGFVEETEDTTAEAKADMVVVVAKEVEDTKVNTMILTIKEIIIIQICMFKDNIKIILTLTTAVVSTAAAAISISSNHNSNKTII